MYRGGDFYDDVKNYQPLIKDKVIAARRLEIDFFKKMGVYSKVPRSIARDKNAKVITTRWIDTNKGDKTNTDYRSRLVGREIKKDTRLDLFAATPPLETMKLLISKCARGQGGRDPMRMAVIDIKRAYLYAAARREVSIGNPRRRS